MDGLEMTERRCLSCEVVKGLRQPVGGAIAETVHFHAHQDVAYPIPGMVIVAAKRHFLALDEMTEQEVAGLLRFMQRIRSGQRAILDVESSYYFYNEDTTHHFHVWMMPRYDWMASFGRSIESVRPILKHAAATVNDDRIRSVEKAVDGLRRWIENQTDSPQHSVLRTGVRMAQLVNLQNAIVEVRAQRGFTTDPVRIFTLLTEEIGEIARELKKSWSPNFGPPDDKKLARKSWRTA